MPEKSIAKALRSYVAMARLIVQTFGEDCEVVLHDLSQPDASVVLVENGHVTGRRVGESFEHLVPDVIMSEKRTGDLVSNYYFTTKDGRLIRSSSLLIRDGSGVLVGALCINVDTSKVQNQISELVRSLPGIAPSRLQALSPLLSTPNNGTLQEDENVVAMVSSLIDRLIGGRCAASMNRERRLELVRFMDSRGIFLMKGAIEQVAEKMGITKVTVYSYLDEVRERTKKNQ